MNSSNVLKMERRKPAPNDSTVRCITKLLSRAVDGKPKVIGIAFVAYVDGRGFISDTCGEAENNPAQTLEMLDSLKAKVAKKVPKK